MATLQKIRNKAGVLVAVIIGLALLAFILGDFLNQGPSVFSRKQMQVAEIDGQSIDYMEYNAKIEELADFYRMNYQMTSLTEDVLENIRDEVWRTTVRDIIMGKAYKDLGISVGIEELKSMLLGDSITAGGMKMAMVEPHPIIKQMFTNPETGEFNRFQMMNYFNAISSDMYQDERKRWIYIENQIVDERMNQKYFNLVRKGIQPNSLDARNYAFESNSTVSFDYVYTSFNSVSDEDIEVTESDIKQYYEENKNEYQQEEGRSIEYVIFPIEPSVEDDQLAKEFIEQSRLPFIRSDNPISFVNNNSDIPYQDINYSRDEFPNEYQDSIFNTEPGYVAGPWFENDAYKIARVLEYNMVPDSVRARHILISLSVQRDESRAEEIADSLLQVIRNGGDFFALAQEFSADESNRSIGGDLGWFTEGTMVKPFNDFAFTNEEGELGVVETRFGYHVIKIEERSAPVKKAKVAIVERQVVPSDATYQAIYSNAVQFRSEATDLEKFRDEYAEQSITPRFASDFQSSANELPGLDNSREIIRWAYENEENTISQIFDLSDKYVVAALTGVKEKGIAPLESVRTEIEIELRKEKKLDQLVGDVNEKISGSGSIEEVASALEADVALAERVRLSNPFVANVGLEPRVVASAYSLEPGILSSPVKGANGVFVLQVTEKNQPEEMDIAAAEQRLKYMMESRVSFEGFEALREMADIEDNRIRFY
jgi:peptidyl-prolyl cis-trans isomerase D